MGTKKVANLTTRDFLFSISINFFKVKRLFLGCCKGTHFSVFRQQIKYD